MIKRVPAMINVFNVPKDGFSFLVKKGKGDYRVFDTQWRYFERELPCRTGDEENVQLFVELLKMFGAGYKMVGQNKVEIFDPECEEYEDVELPLYQEVSSRNYSYMGFDYIAKNVPTKKMVAAAEKYLVKLEKEINRTSLLGEIRVEIDCRADCVSTIIDTDKEVTDVLTEEDLKTYYVRTLNKPYMGRGSYVTLVIDKTAIPEMAKDGVLPITVPKDWAGIVIGKGGRCTKEMARELGLRYIDVKAY